MKKVLSIGEATLDCFIFLKDAEVRCELHHAHCMLCINYADKILAEKLVFTVGGNAANTSVGFARLGLESQLYSIIGDDDNGRRVTEQLEKEGVDQRYVKKDDMMTSYSTAICFQNERSLLVYHEPREYKLPAFEPVDWVYLTSMGVNYRPAYEKVAAFVKKTGAKMSFNPGTFQLHAGVTALKPYFALAEVLFVNKEEAMLLTESSVTTSIIKMAEALYDLGPKIVVITDGPEGAYCFDGHSPLFLEVIPIEAVQRTGTGDAFGSGFTAALVYGHAVDEALRWGMANAAGVVSQIGPETGLLTKDKLYEMLNDNPKIIPKTIHR